MAGRILACGGFGDFLPFLLELGGLDRPRVCYLPTASGDDPAHIVGFYERTRGLGCRPDHVRLFGMPESPATRVLEADIVLVAGGNTANLLALWRLHGLDIALRQVWEAGATLAGASAGANCWFEGYVTDSFGPQLAPLADGIGLLGGSFCPHYDSEPLRRPTYVDLVGSGVLAPGIACDDYAAVLYEGTELVDVVALRAGATAYLVSAASEEPLKARLLDT